MCGTRLQGAQECAQDAGIAAHKLRSRQTLRYTVENVWIECGETCSHPSAAPLARDGFGRA